MRLGLLGTIALIVSAGTAMAQPTASSTAQEGQFLPGPFQVYAVTGTRAQYMHDFFVETDLNPGVAVIALQTPANDALGGLLQKLNKAVTDHKADKLGAFAIILTLDKPFYEDQDRQKRVAELESANKQLTLSDVPLGLSYPDAEPVKKFGILTKEDPLMANVKRHQVTVIVYNKHKIQRRFVFTEDKKLDDAATAEILAAVEKMLKK